MALHMMAMTYATLRPAVSGCIPGLFTQIIYWFIVRITIYAVNLLPGVSQISSTHVDNYIDDVEMCGILLRARSFISKDSPVCHYKFNNTENISQEWKATNIYNRSDHRLVHVVYVVLATLVVYVLNDSDEDYPFEIAKREKDMFSSCTQKRCESFITRKAFRVDKTSMSSTVTYPSRPVKLIVSSADEIRVLVI